MNFITYWKSYVADKSICLKWKGTCWSRLPRILSSLTFGEESATSQKSFKQKTCSIIIVNPNFTWLVQCFTTLSDIQGKRSEEKNLPEQRFVSTVGELSAQMRLGNGQISSSLSLDQQAKPHRSQGHLHQQYGQGGGGSHGGGGHLGRGHGD